MIKNQEKLPPIKDEEKQQFQNVYEKPPKKLEKFTKSEFFSFISNTKFEIHPLTISYAQKTSKDTILQSIEEAYNYISFNEEAIILLGDTGVGKSTFANYIAGIPLKAIGHDFEGLVIEIADKNNYQSFSPIGHHTVSQTLNPVHLTYEGMALWDAPGFGDTRGPNIDIPNCYMIKTLFQKTKKCKIVFVVSENSIKDDNKSQMFIDRIKQIMQLFDDVSKVYDCVFLAVTRVSHFETDSDLCNFIKFELIDKHPEYPESQKKVLEVFTKEERVILFHFPKNEGKIIFSDYDIYGAKFNPVPFKEVGEVQLCLDSEAKKVIKEMCGSFYKDICTEGVNLVKYFRLFFENIIKSNELEKSLFVSLKKQIKILENILMFLNKRSVLELTNIIKTEQNEEIQVLKADLIQSLGLITQKLESFNFFLNMLEIDVEVDDFFGLLSIFQICLVNLNISFQNQEKKLNEVQQIQETLNFEIQQIKSNIESEIMNINGNLLETEGLFHGLIFKKHDSLEKSFENMKFLKKLNIFQILQKNFDDIENLILESKKEEGIFEFLNESPKWQAFWKNLRENINLMKFPLVESFNEVGFMGKDQFSKEDFNDFFKLKCHENKQRNKEIEEDLVAFEKARTDKYNEKKEFLSELHQTIETNIKELNHLAKTDIDEDYEKQRIITAEAEEKFKEITQEIQNLKNSIQKKEVLINIRNELTDKNIALQTKYDEISVEFSQLKYMEMKENLQKEYKLLSENQKLQDEIRK